MRTGRVADCDTGRVADCDGVVDDDNADTYTKNMKQRSLRTHTEKDRCVLIMMTKT